MTVWQVAAGTPNEGRNYEWAFLRYGLAFAGGGANERALQSMKPGHVVILKRGKRQIRAVGRVVERDGVAVGYGDKPWLKDFDGWGLPAYCSVEWHVPDEPVAVRGLTQAAVKRVDKGDLKDIALRILEATPPTTEYAPEPGPTNEVSHDDLLAGLVSEGLSPTLADDLATAVRRIQLLAQYYNDAGRTVSEHETRAFLVAPLLIALGWSEQQLRIEYPIGRARIDIGCFAEPLRTHKDEDCTLIVETKGLWHGLDVARSQAQRYAERLPSAQAIAVTNGYCYKVYRREGSGEFSTDPSAYLNLLTPRDAYPLDPEKGGAVEVLSQLLPRRFR